MCKNHWYNNFYAVPYAYTYSLTALQFSVDKSDNIIKLIYTKILTVFSTKTKISNNIYILIKIRNNIINDIVKTIKSQQTNNTCEHSTQTITPSSRCCHTPVVSHLRTKGNQCDWSYRISHGSQIQDSAIALRDPECPENRNFVTIFICTKFFVILIEFYVFTFSLTRSSCLPYHTMTGALTFVKL